MLNALSLSTTSTNTLKDHAIDVVFGLVHMHSGALNGTLRRTVALRGHPAQGEEGAEPDLVAVLSFI